MMPSIISKTVFMILIVCLVLGMLLFYVFIIWEDLETTETEPVIVDQFPLQQAWRVQLDSSIILPLATWEDKVFARTLDSLYALSAVDGSIIWQRENLEDVSKEILFAGDNLVVAHQDTQTIWVLDTETGTVHTSITDTSDYRGVPGKIESVTLDEQSIYIIQDSSLRVYDLSSSQIRWDGFIGRGVDVFVKNNRFYLVGPQHIQIYDKRTGNREQIIKFVPHLEEYPYPSLYYPASSELLLFRGDNLYFFNISTQSIQLKLKVGKVYFKPRLKETTLFVSNELNEVLAIDIVSDKILWSQKIPGAERLQTPNLLGGYIFVKDEYTGRIYAVYLLTRTVVGHIQIGQRRRETHLPEGINPVVAANKLIFSQGDRVYGYAP